MTQILDKKILRNTITYSYHNFEIVAPSIPYTVYAVL